MSEFDYYQVLQINRTATVDDIKKAFKRLSLRYHPTKNPADITVCSDQFHQICEAYEVLSDFKSRTVYDSYGAETLSRGLHRVSGTSYPGYKYRRNAFEIFEQFYHEYLPYNEIFDDKGKDLYGSCFGYAYGGILSKHKKENKGEGTMHVDWECTLEELYNGCVKEISIKDTVSKSKTEIIEFEIKPGYLDGQEIFIQNKSNPGFESIKADVIVHIRQVAHKKYIRKGNDLIYTHEVKLVDALNAASIKFKTLDGRTLNVSVDEIISPQTVSIIEDEGMPIYDKEEELAEVVWSHKGKMYIRFEIIFPKSLTEEKKQKIVAVLNASSQ